MEGELVSKGGGWVLAVSGGKVAEELRYQWRL